MPRVIITVGAGEGLERCRKFLATRNPQASRRAAQAIERYLALLETAPHAGRPLVELPGLRELIIPFGDAGYVALYLHDATADAVYVLAFRHQREAGYSNERFAAAWKHDP